MLNEMIEDYEGPLQQWTEVKHLWDCLIGKMTQLVPSQRIHVKEALSEIKKIRSVLLKNE